MNIKESLRVPAADAITTSAAAAAAVAVMSTTKAEITRKSFATKIYYRRLNRTSVHISNASNQHTIITPLTSEPFSLLTVLFG